MYMRNDSLGAKLLAIVCFAVAFICVYFGFPDEHAQFGTIPEFVLEASMYSIAVIMIMFGNRAVGVHIPVPAKRYRTEKIVRTRPA